MPMSVAENKLNLVNDDLSDCIILVTIVAIFLICHAIRVFLSFRGYYVFLIEKDIENGSVDSCFTYEVFEYFAITKISDCTLLFNSSINFFVYCLVGKRFRTELASVFSKIRHCSCSFTIGEENENNPDVKMDEVTLASNLEEVEDML